LADFAVAVASRSAAGKMGVRGAPARPGRSPAGRP
jgi:hypothetical protein